MELFIANVKEKMDFLKDGLMNDSRLVGDIDFNIEFIPPYSGAHNISDVKMVIIGQDPTIQGNGKQKDRQKKISSTLDLENKKSPLLRYCKDITNFFGIDIEKEVYATNLCKCVFKEKPAYNGVLNKHAIHWLPLLKDELSYFSDDTIIVSLGQPLLQQLVKSKNNLLKLYWGYKGNSESNLLFNYIEPKDNYIKKRIFPLAHQPTAIRKGFYKHYQNNYLEFIKNNI